MMSKISVSVVLCTYNGQDFISNQLNSILKQSKLPDEIIISDDCSIDNTIDIIRGIQSKVPIVILEHNENLGVVKNFEFALSKANGDLIFLCDQDDIWEENKIMKFVEIYKESNALLIFSNAQLIDENGFNMKDNLWKSIKFNKLKFEQNQFKKLLKRNYITGATVAFDKKILDVVSPFPKEWLHDGWLAMYASIHNSNFFLDENLIKYRQHSNNVVGQSSGLNKKNLNKYISGFKKNIAYDKKRKFEVFYQRYHMYMNKTQIIELNKCIEFWNTLEQSFTKNFFYSKLIIIKQFLLGNYTKYYTGFRGFLRDLIKY